MGSELIKPAVLYTALLGAFLALVLVIWRRDFWSRVGASLGRLAFWSKSTIQAPMAPEPVTVPYGLAIAAGCLLAIIVKG
jgi:Flp pilus assembly protein protease CpaA